MAIHNDSNIISIKSSKPKKLRFKARECPVIDVDGLYEGVLIVLEDLDNNNVVEVSGYNEYFFNSQKKLNSRKNTRLNFAKTVAMFLNSIHFEREFYERSIKDSITKNIDKIENLSIEDGNTFLKDYKFGRAGKTGLKSRSSIEAVERRLAQFYFYLFQSPKYKMRNLNKSHFKFQLVEVKKDNKKVEKIVLQSPFLVKYPEYKEGSRLEEISFYVLSELIILALEHYPMIALGIAAQAFGGLRKGEVPNMSWDNIKWRYIGKELRSFCINLITKRQLRSDGVDVGQIKSREIAYIHPAFLEYFDLLFKEHKRYIEEDFLKKNKYGALFMNRDGEAMTHRSYEYAFNELTEMLINKLMKTGNPRAISEANMMLEKKFTTHTLRYFFTEYIASLPDTNIFEIAMFRRDRSLNSAMRYIRNNPYLIDNKIKEFQRKEY